ncbi:hypothetical protein OIO90_002773 [Microbotryomycetes sp. JL221]|nr:hypothetical protein OIO90_002773 [Microbotryomycetes sp. JL221]
MSQLDTAVNMRAHLYSVYTMMPRQAVDLRPTTSRKRQRSSAKSTSVDALERIMTRGPAMSVLDEVRLREAKRLSRTTNEIDDDENDDATVDRSLDQAHQTDDEDEDARDAGDEISDRRIVASSGNKKRRQKSGEKIHGKRKRRSATSGQDEIPRIERPTKSIPEHFPSADLLWSILTDTSDSLSSSFNILPTLTADIPSLPPDAIAHFEDVIASQAQQELDQLTANPTTYQLRKIERRRISRQSNVAKGDKMRRGHKNSWRNCEKQFEASALVAIGMLLELVAKDIASDSNEVLVVDDSDNESQNPLIENAVALEPAQPTPNPRLLADVLDQLGR